MLWAERGSSTTHKYINLGHLDVSFSDCPTVKYQGHSRASNVAADLGGFEEQWSCECASQ